MISGNPKSDVRTSGSHYAASNEFTPPVAQLSQTILETPRDDQSLLLYGLQYCTDELDVTGAAAIIWAYRRTQTSS